MAQEILVETQIPEGRRLIERLAAEGVPVTGAGWLKESETGEWYLYLATPLVSEEGHKLAAYGRVNEVIRRLEEPLLIGPLEIMLVSPGSPVGKALRELQKRPPAPPLIRLGSSRLGDVSIDAAFVYPRVPATVG
jgi:hypothetical protein